MLISFYLWVNHTILLIESWPVCKIIFFLIYNESFCKNSKILIKIKYKLSKFNIHMYYIYLHIYYCFVWGFLVKSICRYFSTSVNIGYSIFRSCIVFSCVNEAYFMKKILYSSLLLLFRIFHYFFEVHCQK